MKKLIFSLLVLSSLDVWGAPKNFFELETKSIDDKVVNFTQYKGKVVLAVNTASECGFTTQYKDLEALYQKYKGKGLVVLGFPSNDFGGQEPGSNASIKKFCELKYKVTFPLFTKSVVKGEAKQPVYQFLTTTAPEAGEVSWNFEKFLIDRSGKVTARYKSAIEPLSADLTAAIEKELGKTL